MTKDSVMVPFRCVVSVLISSNLPTSGSRQRVRKTRFFVRDSDSDVSMAEQNAALKPADEERITAENIEDVATREKFHHNMQIGGATCAGT